MSPLTKLFVVLLVILSMLMTAATVVFVNKEDEMKASLETTRNELSAQRAKSEQAENERSAAEARATAAQLQANTQTTQANAAVTAAQQQIANLNVDLAKARSDAAAEQLNVSKLSAGLETAQATMGRQYDEITRMRTASDQMVRQVAEMNTTISDLTNRLDVTERERRNLAEQLAEAQNQSQKLGLQLKGLGIAPEAALAAEAKAAPGPINGVVRRIDTFGGRKYATISVGSADSVAKGMEFKVVNRDTGDFLGNLTVDSVEPNEATGRLEGPRVGDIKPGVEVKTQL